MDLSEDILLRDFIFKMGQRRIVKLPGRIVKLAERIVQLGL